MKLLLDTHVLLWAVGNPQRLPEHVYRVLEHPDNDLLFNAASIREVVCPRRNSPNRFTPACPRGPHGKVRTMLKETET